MNPQHRPRTGRRAIIGRWIGIWGVAAIMAAFLAGAAAPKPKYEFKQNFKAGERFSVLGSTVLTGQATAIYRGQAVGRSKVSLDGQAQIKGIVTVLEVAAGAPTAERIAYDPGCGIVLLRPGQGAEMKATKFAGKTITVRQDSEGRISHDLDDADGVAERELRNVLSRDAVFYPGRPVSIGERWEINQRFGERLSALPAGTTFNGICKLKDVKATDGRRMAHLEVSLGLIGSRAAEHAEGQLEGTVLIDLESGRVMKMDVKGTVSVAERGAVRTRSGQSVPVNGVAEIGMEYHEICKRVVTRAATRPATQPVLAGTR